MDYKEAWVLSKFILVVVVTIGVFSVFNFTTRKGEQQSLLDQMESRRPASLIKISELGSSNLISKATVSTLDLNCLESDKTMQLKSQSHQLRLIGKACAPEGDNSPPSEIIIKNMRNGYQASVFNLDDESFSTDYLFLEKGNNSIIISRVEDDNMSQTVIAELEIERQDKFILDSDTSTTPIDSKSNQ